MVDINIKTRTAASGSAVTPEKKKGQPSFLSPERRRQRRLLDDKGFSDNRMMPIKRKKSRWWKWLTIVVVLLILFFYLSSVFTKVTVTVTPREEVVNVDLSALAYKDNDTPGRLGYQVIALSKTDTEMVKGAGIKHVERQASVKLKVYNKHQRSPFLLIKKTRFESPGGLVFRIRDEISVPGYRKVDGEIIPGSLEVTAYADEPGEQYNVGPGRFTVPGLAGSSSENNIFAESGDPASGGFRGTRAVIEDADLDAARDKLEKSVTDTLLADIASEIPDGVVFFPESYALDFAFEESSVSGDGDGTGEQPVKLIGTIYAAVFDKGELSSYIAGRELSSFGDANVEIANWGDLEIEIDDFDVISRGEEMRLSLNGPARFIWQLDEESVKADLAGIRKQKGQYDAVFVGYTAIDRAEVVVRPVWRKSLPKDTDDITIVTRIEGLSL